MEISSCRNHHRSYSHQTDPQFVSILSRKLDVGEDGCPCFVPGGDLDPDPDPEPETLGRTRSDNFAREDGGDDDRLAPLCVLSSLSIPPVGEGSVDVGESVVIGGNAIAADDPPPPPPAWLLLLILPICDASPDGRGCGGSTAGSGDEGR